MVSEASSLCSKGRVRHRGAPRILAAGLDGEALQRLVDRERVFGGPSGEDLGPRRASGFGEGARDRQVLAGDHLRTLERTLNRRGFALDDLDVVQGGDALADGVV